MESGSASLASIRLEKSIMSPADWRCVGRVTPNDDGWKATEDVRYFRSALAESFPADGKDVSEAVKKVRASEASVNLTVCEGGRECCGGAESSSKLLQEALRIGG